MIFLKLKPCGCALLSSWEEPVCLHSPLKLASIIQLKGTNQNMMDSKSIERWLIENNFMSISLSSMRVFSYMCVFWRHDRPTKQGYLPFLMNCERREKYEITLATTSINVAVLVYMQRYQISRSCIHMN